MVPPPPAAQVSQVVVTTLVKSGQVFKLVPSTTISLMGQPLQLVYGWTKFYLSNRAAPYTPATLRGAWDDTAAVVTKALENGPLDSLGSDSTTFVDRAETNASTTWDVLLYRGVSGPLAAQTISGNVDVCISVRNYFSSGSFRYHLHIYVTQGDSDTPRGTLLSDYVDSANWTAITQELGIRLAAVQALSSLAISDGDRIVVEVGYQATNSSTSSFTGRIVYGWNGNGATLRDLKSGENAPTTGTTAVGFVEFQSTIAPSATVAGRVSQDPALVLVRPDPAGRVSQLPVLVPVRPSNPDGRVSQLPVLVIIRPNTFIIPSGTITLTGQSLTRTVDTPIPIPSGTITLTGYPPILGGDLTIAPAAGQIDLIGQTPVVLLSLTILIPSGLISLVSDAPTVVIAPVATTAVRLTSAGQLVATQPTTRDAEVTSFGQQVLDTHPGVAVEATAVAQNVLDKRTDISAQVSSVAALVLIHSRPEIAPEIGSSFGPLVWVEFESPDGTVPVWAAVDLPDPPEYYHGFKVAKVLEWGKMTRALSDEKGNYETQKFSVTVSDAGDRYVANLLGSNSTRLLLNKRMVVRMISDPDRRLLKTPRTVGIGISRSYRAE